MTVNESFSKNELERLERQIASLKRKLAKAEAQYGKEHPAIVRLRKHLSVTQRETEESDEDVIEITIASDLPHDGEDEEVEAILKTSELELLTDGTALHVTPSDIRLHPLRHRVLLSGTADDQQSLFLVTDSLTASPTDPPAATKEAVIDVAWLIKSLPEFVAGKDNVQENIRQADKQMRDLQIQIESLTKQKAEADGDEDAELGAKIAEAHARIRVETETMRNKLRNQEAQLYARVFRRIKKAIAEHAQENGIHIVRRATKGSERERKLDSGNPQDIIQAMNEEVLYIADERMDITQAVFERLTAEEEE